MKTISVIVPVYNAEAYLQACVDSILQQEYPSIKVILVNDGSTDSSGDICRQLEREHDNISVIHKPNGGVSSARNAGLDAADTPLVTFADADDILAPELFSTLIKAMEEKEADRAVGGFYHFYDDGRKILRKPRIADGLYTCKALLPGMIDDGTLFGFHFSSVNNSIYKKAVLDKHGIRFRSHIRYNEDSLFNLEYTLATETMVSLRGIPLYYYRQHGGSATAKRTPGDKYGDLRKTLYALSRQHEIPEFDRQMKRRGVTEALWQVMDIARAYNYPRARREIAAVLKKQDVRQGMKEIQVNRLNIYKKYFYYLMKWKMATALYVSVRWVLPGLSKRVSR